MTHRATAPVPVAAARAGFSPATGYRIEQDPRRPSEKRAPRGGRRPMLEASPGLRPVAVLEPRRMAEKALTAVLQEAYIHGVSTRAATW